MSPDKPARIELQNRFFYVAPQAERKLIRWALIVFVVVVAITAFYLNRIFPLEQIDWEKVARHAGKVMARDLWDLFFLIVAILASLVQLVYFKRVQRLERMILTDTDIEYQSALPRVLQFLMPGWSLKWTEVSRAYLRRKRGVYGAGAIELVLVTYQEQSFRLRPFFWVDPTESEPETPWRSFHRSQVLKAEDYRSAILGSPVVRFVAAHLPRFELESSWDKVSLPYALESSRGALVAIALIFVLIVYTIVDLVINEEAYASRPPYSLYVLVGVLVALVTGRWLHAGNVPYRERVGIAVVLGAVLGFALYPGFLRINEMTDRVGLRTYVYQLQADGSLAPLQQGLPELRFPRYADYWSKFAKGSLHEFRLRRGRLGFYQIDMAPINEAMREYFQGR